MSDLQTRNLEKDAMLRFKTLETTHHLLNFCNGYREALKGKMHPPCGITVENMREKTKVVGVYMGEEMVAGYTLSAVPHSALIYMNQEAKNKMANLGPIESFCDLASIWKRKGLSKFIFNSIVWPRIVIDTILFNRHQKYVIGYSITGHGRKESYDLTKPIFLQSSPVQNEINIFVMTRKNLFMGFFKALLYEVLPKSLKKSPKETSKTTSFKKKEEVSPIMNNESQQNKGRQHPLEPTL